MTEYIEREKTFLALADNSYSEEMTLMGYDRVLAALANIPAAEVRPVVRGKWKDAMQGCHDSPHVKCSICGEYYWQYFKKFNYCPNCGADMREAIS